MNFPSHNCLLFLVTCFIFTSCTKSTNSSGTKTDTTKSTTTDTTIYIAGNNGTNPILWKNGTADTLSTTIGSASQVIVSGNDVYVGGISQGNQNIYSSPVLNGPLTGQYGYWKNGVQNNIGSIENIGPPPSISLGGNNVYYSNGSAWENGTIITLPNQDSGSVQSIFASGNDIYAAGYDSARDAVYWKNGQLNIVSAFQGHGYTTPLVYCIAVSGSDVYVGGMYNQAAFWKNGVINYLQYTTNGSFVSYISSLLLSGNDVYATGHLIGTNLGAAYWKNGIENDLQISGAANGNTTYTTTSIFLDGLDVYVAGYTSTFVQVSTTYLDSAVYWKNGVEINLKSSGIANSIYVQKTTN
jgi:hypothetical protein